MPHQQIRLTELLREDPLYKKWFQKIPEITVKGATPPWRLFVQREEGGRWAKADYPSYAKAYNALRPMLLECFDATIHSKRQHFSPPIIRKGQQRVRIPMPPGHSWCSLCRRPTLFLYFTKHRALKYCLPEEKRCLICGMAQRGMKSYRSPLSWPAQ